MTSGCAPIFLEPGRFYGENRSERRTGELILSEAQYAPAQRVPPHVHQRAYFAYLVGGGYWEQLGPRGSTFQPRSLVFHPPREVRSGDISDRGAHLFHVELPDPWLDRMREHGALPDAAIEHHRGPLVRFARAIYGEFHAPDAASSLVIEGVTLEMLGALVRARTASGPGGKRATRGTPIPAWLTRARDLLHAHALAAPSLAAIASAVDVSPVRLARAFRRAFGESPGDYVRRERIRVACERLAAGDVALGALARELGFFDQSHFTRVFREQLGVAPGTWQRAHAPRRGSR